MSASELFEEVSRTAADLGVRELRHLGRSLREQAPRTAIGSWSPSADRQDPVELIRASNADRLPNIVPIRVARMAADPFSFLRGSAGAMAADLGPLAVSGIPAQICGDAHLMNFGLFATTERNLVFDLNDFDETISGAWEWDLLRLVASLETAARANQMGPGIGDEAVRTASSAYRDRMAELSELSAIERRYLRIDIDDVLDSLRTHPGQKFRLSKLDKTITKARTRDRFQALEKFTEIVDGHRRIIPDPPIVQPLDEGVFRDDLLNLYASYRSTLPSHVAQLLDNYRFVDIALKVVGVGSVGTRALMVLFEGRADLDPLFLQIKEAVPSVLAPFASGPAWTSQSQRVVEGQRLMQAAGDMFLGWGHAGGRDYFVRQLRDMKGGADLTRMTPSGFVQYARFCGVALANAHSRTQHPALISGYLGVSERLDEALAKFAVSYSDQTERDHAALVAAIGSGSIESVMA